MGRNKVMFDTERTDGAFLMKRMRTLLLLCLAVTSAAADKQLPCGVKFRINTTIEDDQTNPAAASLDGGNCIVIWQSNGQEKNGGYGWGIYGQILDEAGGKIREEFQANTYAEMGQYNPVVLALAGGNFFVGWESNRFSDIDPANVGQFFDSNGLKTGNELRISPSSHYKTNHISVCRLRDGRFVFLWETYGQEGWDIYAQILSADGGTIGSEFRVNTTTSWDQVGSRITALQDGGFGVIWRSEYISDDWGEAESAYFQIFSADGGKVGSETPLFQNALRRGYQVPIAEIMPGRFVVAWENFGSSFEIVAQLFASDGSKFGSRFLANTNTAGPSIKPAVVPLKNGKFMICWQNMDSNWEGKSVSGQIFSLDGQPIDLEFIITDPLQVPNQGPHIASLKDGEFLVYWEELNREKEGMTVFGQRFSEDGESIRRNFEICSYSGNMPRPLQIVPLSEDGYFCCWSDYDGSGLGVYGKRMPYSPQYHELNAFSLVGPLNDATALEDTVNFIWHQPTMDPECYPWDITFDLIIGTDPEFVNPLVISDLYDTTWAVNRLRPGMTYFWKVLARNSAGETRLNEPPGYGFYIPNGNSEDTLSSELNNFSLIYPTDEVQLSSTDVTLQWQKASAGRFYYPPDIYYTVWIDTLPGFGTPIKFTDVMDTSWTVENLSRGLTYYWKILANNHKGDSLWCRNQARFRIFTDEVPKPPEKEMPKKHALRMNYPNPFNAFTTVPYELASDVHVSIGIFSIRGEMIREIVHESRTAGFYSFQWDGTNHAGKSVPSGIYICRMEARSPDGQRFVKSVKMGLVR
jgi:hypothetical protein